MKQKVRNQVHGWVVLDKPLGLSSTQALGKVRHLFNAAKAGHGGTLDPLATGLLPIALGEATKTIPWIMDGRKTYRFTVQWGAETNTDDLEGAITARSDKFEFNQNNILPRNMDIAVMQQEITAILPKFIGAVQQKPPSYSAIKVAGERAYDLARAGEEVDLPARQVSIESLLAVNHSASQTTFEVACGKGTYVRALARDMGRALGWLGHVTLLRRLAVGPFSEGQMISLEKLAEMSHSPASENSLTRILRPIETVLDGIPALAVMDPDAQRLRQGQQVLLRGLPGDHAFPSEAEKTSDGGGREGPAAAEVVLVTHGGKPLGLCSLERGMLKPKRLFNL